MPLPQRPPPTSRLAVLLIGAADRPELRWVAAKLAELCDVTQLGEIRDVELDLPPEAIVLLQSYPGQWPVNEVEQLRHRWPLAKLFVVYAPLCAGEARSGRLLAGAQRLAWHAFLPRFERDLELRRTGACPSWGLPALASEEERLLRTPPREVFENAVGGNMPRVWVSAPEREQHEWLIAASRAAGLEPTLDEKSAQLGLWQGRWREDQLPEDLKLIAAKLTPRPVVAIVDFPTAAHTHPNVLVLGGPVLLDDITTALNSCLAPVFHTSLFTLPTSLTPTA